MDDTDDGVLVSTEDEHLEESKHGNLEKKISKLKLKLKGFEQVIVSMLAIIHLIKLFRRSFFAHI